ncbi:Rib/alpha-like domain-containing protein [Enterococcus ratti]|uniref:Rib/alpha-like domain-containing protein n=1 Tax=Enterococcus ratti TaxID=150033 RepID=UPI0035147407
MKKFKKLLNGAVVVGLTLGNSSGTVVGAVTTVNETTNTNQVTKKESVKKEKQKKDSESSSSKSSKKEQKSISPRKATAKEEIAKTSKIYMENKLKELINKGPDTKIDNYEVEDQYVFKKRLFSSYNYHEQTYYKPDIPSGKLSLDRIYLNIRDGSTGMSAIHPVEQEVISKSGNWKIKFEPTEGDTTNGCFMTLKFTRLKVAKPQTEIFPMKVTYVVLPGREDADDGEPFAYITGAKIFDTDILYEVNMPVAEIGDITAKAKTGEHTVMQNDPVPKAADYVASVENTRGTVEYKWKTAPNMKKPGKQTSTVTVSDDTGRSVDVPVSLTVTPLPLEMTPKAGAHQVYMFDEPKAKDYFDVVNHYDGTSVDIQWVDAPDVTQLGKQICKAKATSSDGRTAENTVELEVVPLPPIELTLKPIEDRTLGHTYASLADTFKNYVESATVNGKALDLETLEFIPEKSTEPNMQLAGQQTVRIAVKAHVPKPDISPRSSVNASASSTDDTFELEGTAETTVNVRWGSTILMKSANGASAGAFSLIMDKSSAGTGILSIQQGLNSPLNEAVNPNGSPFEAYYHMRILRNDKEIYAQTVQNRSSLQQVIDYFGNSDHTQAVKVDDIVEIYYPEKSANHSVLMVDEAEHDYTYASAYAYYKVTPYGFEPAPKVEAEAANADLVLAQGTDTIDVKQLLKNVKLNNQEVEAKAYTATALDAFDTTTVGQRNMRVKLTAADGLASKEIDVPYQVKWGSTFVLKGLNDATVGAYSLVKKDEQWTIQSTQGVADTNLTDPVDNYFGSQTYYQIDVLQGDVSKYHYEVLGNSTIDQAIHNFNQGQPLQVAVGDVVKVYHADPKNHNLLMQDELVKDYTVGSNYAYYQVTEHGFEPILDVKAKSQPQEFTLGENSSKIDGTKLIENITINGVSMKSDQYTVTQLEDFDTSVAGEKNLRIKIETKDGIVSKEIGVPYTVKWGNSILVKSSTGGSAGAFSLLDGKELAGTSSDSKVLQINPGLDSSLNEKVGADETSTYYSIDITRDGRSTYKQTIPGRATLQQIMDNFGNASRQVTVQTGDIVTITQPQKTPDSSVLWMDEVEKDFTYGSEKARYEVTDYGLVPAPELTGTTANKQLNLAEQAENIDLRQLVKVTINGHEVTDDLYTVKQLTDFDTNTVGKKEVKLQLDLNDGYASTEVDIPYEVKWGDSLVLKGLNGATAGTYSFVKRDEQWFLCAVQGDPDADLSNWVNNEYGRDIYYRIEVETNGNELPAFETLQALNAGEPPVNNGNFAYNVTGNMTVDQAISGFNNGQPLPLPQNAIIKVYHAESSNNLLVRDDLVRDYTAGSNYACYKVDAAGVAPITNLKAETVETKLTLGQDASSTDVAQLVKNVQFNDQKLKDDLYKVEPIDTFDTSTVGEKELKVKLTTSDDVTTKEIKVPYTVNWGSSLVMKNKQNETIGAFSLKKEDKKLELTSLPGKNKKSLSKRITNINDKEVYYSIEVFNQNKSKYKYEVRGALTIEEAINRFNSGKPLDVSVGDQIKVYHKESTGNIYMYEEMEQNYTYGTNYAYYNVTEYGFEPTGELTVTPLSDVKVTVGTDQVDLKSLLKEVKVNGKALPKNSYTIKLDPDSTIDTSELGKKTAKMTVAVDKAYGEFSTPTQVDYEVVDGAGNVSGENAGADGDAAGSAGENGTASGSLPKTNETKNAAFSLLGVFLVSVVGMIVFWKKKKTNEKTEK